MSKNLQNIEFVMYCPYEAYQCMHVLCFHLSKFNYELQQMIFDAMIDNLTLVMQV